MKYSVFYLLGLFFVMQVSYADTTLELMPSKCVTLKEGKTCYQDVKVIWQSTQKADYCLFEKGNQNPLKCWQNSQKGKFKFEFQQPLSVDYQLMLMPDKKLIKQQQLSVKWVYKKRPNLGWRLF